MSIRRRIPLLAAALLVGLLAAVPAFLAGVWVGADQLLIMESTPRAALLVGELRSLREGKIERLVQAKELELDAQVLLYARSERQGYPWLFWPFNGSIESERHLRLLAQYRKQYSSNFPPGTAGASRELPDAEGVIKETTRDIVLRYAK